MNSPANQPAFGGIIPPLVTPLADRDTLDEAGLGRLLEHVIAGGVRGIFVLGTTGEAASLSYRLRRELITQVCERVNGRVPVLVGITDTSFTESVNLALVAADAGAAAVVLAPPYYFPASQSELLKHVEALLAELELPLLLYNIPSLTKVAFEFETVRRLSGHAGIAGIKDSSGDLDFFGRLVGLKAARPDWSVLIGPEHLLPDAVVLGGDGGVAGGANVFPRLFVECFEASACQDEARLQPLRERIDQVQRLYDVGDGPCRFLKVTKGALGLLDICSDRPAEPLQRLSREQRESLQGMLKSILTFASSR